MKHAVQQVSIAELTVQWQMIQYNNNAIFSLGNEESKGHTESDKDIGEQGDCWRWTKEYMLETGITQRPWQVSITCN